MLLTGGCGHDWVVISGRHKFKNWSKMSHSNRVYTGQRSNDGRYIL